MDESLFIFSIAVFFFCVAAIIYCFLSTCLGVRLRRADVWEAISTSTNDQRRQRGIDDDDDYNRPLWNDHGSESAEAIEMLGRPTQRRDLY